MLPRLLPRARPFGLFGRISLTRMVQITLLALALFLLLPGLDRGVAAIFYRPGEGFFLDGNPFLEVPRRLIWDLSLVIALGAMAMVLAHPLRRRARYWPTRVWVFISLLTALGPGLLVNGLLKAHWGRARPRHLIEFGGSWHFTPPFQISGECLRNCSFVSGEASGAMALAIALFVLARTAPSLRPRRALRVAGIAVLLVWPAMRIAAGGHFLSDVVFALLLTWMLAESLMRFFRFEDPMGEGLGPIPLRGRPRAAGLAGQMVWLRAVVSRRPDA